MPNEETYDVACVCGAHTELRVPSGHPMPASFRCPVCGTVTRDWLTAPQPRQPAPQHDISGIPWVQKDTRTY